LQSPAGYALDGVGNRLHVVESTGNRVTWTYDKTYQLRNEQRSGSNGYNITYTYDPVGNRLVEINGGARTTSTFDAANQLAKTHTVGGVTTYTSDAAGNLLTARNPSNQRTTNTWEHENRLTRVLLPSSVPNTFVYNGDGQRVQKQDSTGTTKHAWDGQNILLETDGSNVIQVVYTLEPMLDGNLISERRSGTTSFYLFDALGSTTQLVSNAGAVTDRYVYDSWGNILLTTGSSTNWFRYVGHLGYYFDNDVTRYYIRARYYDPASGRFISRDQFWQQASAGTGAGLQTYSYARNDSATFVDPSEFFACTPILVTLCLGCFGTVSALCAALCYEQPWWDKIGEGYGACLDKCVKCKGGSIGGVCSLVACAALIGRLAPAPRSHF
jgi:RHS repeat-associated protein